MKLILFFALLFCFSSTLKSQVWIDSGAVWHYDYESFSPTKGFYKYSYTNDTMIQGYLCQEIELIEHRFVSFGSSSLTYSGEISRGSMYTYVNGDTVFYYENTQFYQLLRFNAAVGDTWIISVRPTTMSNASDTSEVIVVNVDSVLIGNQYYRTIELEMNTCAEIHYVGTFVERFGLLTSSTSNLFPTETFYPCPFDSSVFYHPTEYTFKCFEDNSFNLYNLSGEDCEYFLSILGNEELMGQKWSVLPNPANNLIQILGENISNKELAIFNILGQLITKTTISSDNFNLPLNDFESGIYFLMVEGSKQVRKLVIE